MRLNELLDDIRWRLITLEKIAKKVIRKDDLIDPILRGALERYLETIIMDFIDFGARFIAERGLQKPTKYSEIPHILAENDFIDESLMEIYLDIISFRHILAHRYRRINLDKLFWTIGGGLKDLKKLFKWAAKIVEKYNFE